MALTVYAAFALGSHVLGFPALVALLAVPVAAWSRPRWRAICHRPEGSARILRSADRPS